MTKKEMRIAIAESEGVFKRKDGEVVEYQVWRGDFMFQRVRFPDGRVSPCHIENVLNYDRDKGISRTNRKLETRTDKESERTLSE